MDRGAWQATVHGVAKSQAWLSIYHSLTFIYRDILNLYMYIFTITFTYRNAMYLYMYTSLVAQMVKNVSAMQETQVRSLGREYPLEKGMATHSSILTWRMITEEPGGLQSMALESDPTERLSTDARLLCLLCKTSIEWSKYCCQQRTNTLAAFKIKMLRCLY